MHYEIKVISAPTATLQYEFTYNNGYIEYVDHKYQLHRENGPATIDIDGTKIYYKHGYCHRMDGPAVELSDGTLMWYINGERLSPEKEKILNQWWDNKHGI